MTRLVPLLIVLFASMAVCQNQQMYIGEIEFFGAAGVNLEQVRNALPLREGDAFDFNKGQESLQPAAHAIKEITGSEPTDIAPVCCDEHGAWTIYIGLRGTNFRTFNYNAAPKNSARLPAEIVQVYQQAMNLLLESIQNQATEDDSKGYALSSYPPLRAKELALREYATHNESLARRVLMFSSDAEQRAIAAHIIGYARQSKAQIMILVRASRDADEGVRNNAVRALLVLANSRSDTADSIPANRFVDMLNSGVWTDRNKSGTLLGILSKRRDPRLLRLLHTKALQSLVEMARWRDARHASDARIILGRIAGIEEKRLIQLVAASEVDEIVRSLPRIK